MKHQNTGIINRLQQIRQYSLSHIWCSLFLLVLAAAGSLFGITKGYLNSQYVEYLSERTYDAENNILQLADANIREILDEFIQTGSLAGTDDELYDLTQKLQNPGTFPVYKSIAYSKISNYAYYSQWIAGVSVLDETQILTEYWRNGQNKTWSTAEKEQLFKTCKEIIKARQLHSIPAYACAGSGISEDMDKVLIHLAFPIVGKNGTNKCSSVIVLSLSGDFLKTSLQMNTRSSQTELAYGFITNEDGQILYHTDSRLIGTDGDEYARSKQLNILSLDLNRLGWTLNIGIDVAKMQNSVNAIYNSGSWLYFLWIAVVLLLLIFLISRILRPIQTLSESMETVRQGNYEEQIKITGQNEIWKLAEEFNRMARSVLQMRQTLEQEHQKHLVVMRQMQEAEKQALESQINAHFICNTISAINYEAIENGNQRVSVMLKKLSNILRYTFDQKHQRVYMNQEIAWLEQYLYLQRFRYEGVFDYTIHIPDEVKMWPCCKLMFQPFVENSILHGFCGMESGGRIDVTGRLQNDGYLKIVISDNGCGMPDKISRAIQEELKEGTRNPSLGIGISNVGFRLQYYYGNRAVLSLQSYEGKGTKVTFLIPQEMEQNLIDKGKSGSMLPNLPLFTQQVFYERGKNENSNC